MKRRISRSIDVSDKLDALSVIGRVLMTRFIYDYCDRNTTFAEIEHEYNGRAKEFKAMKYELLRAMQRLISIGDPALDTYARMAFSTIPRGVSTCYRMGNVRPRTSWAKSSGLVELHPDVSSVADAFDILGPKVWPPPVPNDIFAFDARIKQYDHRAKVPPRERNEHWIEITNTLIASINAQCNAHVRNTRTRSGNTCP